MCVQCVCLCVCVSLSLPTEIKLAFQQRSNLKNNSVGKKITSSWMTLISRRNQQLIYMRIWVMVVLYACTHHLFFCHVLWYQFPILESSKSSLLFFISTYSLISRLCQSFIICRLLRETIYWRLCVSWIWSTHTVRWIVKKIDWKGN